MQSYRPALDYKLVLKPLPKAISKNKLKLRQSQIYLAQGQGGSLIYGVITPFEEYLQGSISKEELDKEYSVSSLYSLS